MEYSKIKTLRLQNFRNLKDVTIDFGESPIVTLRGENDAGKTSVIKGMTVIALNGFSKRQARFIRRGTNGFGIEVTMEDGSRILRIKQPSVNGYKVFRADGSTWACDKIDASGPPEEVEKILGFVEEPETKEYLQVRTCDDQLLFVTTPSSTAYKVMYNALKVDNLTAAIRQGSEEANELKAEINDCEASMQTLSASMKSLRIIDIEPALMIKERIEREISQIGKLEKAKDILDNVCNLKAKLGSIEQIREAKEVSIEEAMTLDKLQKLIAELKKVRAKEVVYRDAVELEEIDYAYMSKLSNVVTISKALSKLYKKKEMLAEAGSLEEINSASIERLSKIKLRVEKIESLKERVRNKDLTSAEEISSDEINVINRLNKVTEVFNRYNGAKEKLDILKASEETQSKEYNEYLVECGAVVGTCPKCGETVVMEKEA